MGYMQRKMAASMALSHTITFGPADGSLRMLRVVEKGGPMVIDSLFVIGGPPEEFKVCRG